MSVTNPLYIENRKSVFFAFQIVINPELPRKETTEQAERESYFFRATIWIFEFSLKII
jgi:hypothetical protein